MNEPGAPLVAALPTGAERAMCGRTILREVDGFERGCLFVPHGVGIDRGRDYSVGGLVNDAD